MKKTLTVIFLLISIITLPCKAITKKEAILIVNKALTTTAFEAEFYYCAYDRSSYSVLYDYNAHVTVSGKMYLLKTSTNTIICDGNTIWTYLPQENEVHVAKASEQFNLWNILPIYNKFYSIETINEIDDENEKYYLVELFSKDKDNDFKKMVLKINSKNHNLVQLHVYESEDILHIFEIFEVKPIIKLPKSNFIFNEKNHPNVEKVDLKKGE